MRNQNSKPCQPGGKKGETMKKSIIIAILVTLVTVTSAFAQTPDWSTYNGGQILITLKAESLDLGHQWSSLAKVCTFVMPGDGFTQAFCYVGASKGIWTFDGGMAVNWNGGDHPFLGIMADVPFGRCLWSTEVDNMLNTHQEQYLWSGIDINSAIFGGHTLFFGPQVEAIRIGKTCAQIGAHLGLDKIQFSIYSGDRGYNARVCVTVPLN